MFAVFQHDICKIYPFSCTEWQVVGFYCCGVLHCAYVCKNISQSIHSIHRNLSGFQSGAMPKGAVINLLHQFLCEHICAGLLSHRECISSASVNTAKAFSKVVVPVYSPRSSVRQFYFLHVLADMWCFLPL